MSRLGLCVRNMASNLVGWVVPVALNVVSVPLLLHRLGPDAYGLSNLVIVLTGYFSVMDMGMDIAGVKLLAEYRAGNDSQSINRLMSTKFTIYLGMGSLGMVLVLALAGILATRFFSIPEAFKADSIVVFRLAAFSILANFMISWASVVPQGLQRYDVFNGISVGTGAISTCAGLAAVYAGYGVVGFVLVRVLANWLAAGASFVMVYRLLPTLRLRLAIDRDMLRRIFGITVFGFLIKMAGMLAASVDRTLIGVWIGTASVAAYSVPYMVTTYLNQITLRMMHFVFPMSSEMLQLGQVDKLKAIFIKASKFTVAVNTVIVLPTAMLGDRFLTLWVGAKIASQSANPFRLLLLACYLSSMVSLFTHIMIGIGYVRQFTILFLIRTAVLTILCLVLIHPLGIMGAAIAAVGASVTDIAFGAFSLVRYLKIPVIRFFGAYGKPVALGICLSWLVYFARPFINSWITLASAVVMYGVLFVVIGLFTGVFDSTERELLLRIPRALLNRAGARAAE